MSPVDRLLHLALAGVPPDQSRAQTGHLGHIAPQHTLGFPRLFAVVLFAQCLADPGVHLGPAMPGEAHFLTGRQQSPDLLQA